MSEDVVPKRMYDIMRKHDLWQRLFHPLRDNFEAGSVQLIDVMPRIVPEEQTCDNAIAHMARVSYGQGTSKTTNDEGLIRRLMKDEHDSPFEGITLKFRIRCPVYVYRQWFRHRSTDQSECEIITTDENARKYVSMNEYCLVPGTRVLLPNLTWKKIEDLTVGEELVGFNEEPLNLKKNKFLATKVEGISRQTLPCRKIVTEHGTVTASHFHKWVVQYADQTGYRWIETRRLKPGMKIAFSAKPWEVATDFDSGWLSGILDGEGWVSGALLSKKPQSNGGVSFHLGVAQNEGPVLERIKNLLTARGIHYGCHRQHGTGSKGLCQTVAVSRRYDVLRLLGETRPQRLLDKVLPVWMNSGKIAGTASEILEVEEVGWQPTIGVNTEAKTLVAEGFLSHNSARYSVVPNVFYIPQDLRLQSKTNRQGGDEKVDPAQNIAMVSMMEQSAAENRKLYETLLAAGVSRELARSILPVCYITEFYFTANILNLLRWLRLRWDPHAQEEIRAYAGCIAGFLGILIPKTLRAFENYVLHATKFSFEEMILIRDMLSSRGTTTVDPLAVKYVKESISPKEYAEFLEKLQGKRIPPPLPTLSVYPFTIPPFEFVP